MTFNVSSLPPQPPILHAPALGLLTFQAFSHSAPNRAAYSLTGNGCPTILCSVRRFMVDFQFEVRNKGGHSAGPVPGSGGLRVPARCP